MKKILKKLLNQKKSGFTLIELLAVIIILAVIALIATPIVLNVVDNAKEKARQSSVAGYADATKLSIHDHMFGNNGQVPPMNQAFIDSIKPQGEKVTCTDVLYSSNYGVVLNECNVGSNNNNYCFATGKTYACDDKTYTDILDDVKGNNDGALTPTREDCFDFDDETKTITGYKCGNRQYDDAPDLAGTVKDVVIPETINGISVEHIGSQAFRGNASRTIKFDLVKDLVTIGVMAFDGGDFTDLDLSMLTKLTSIEYESFNNGNLETIKLPKNIITIESQTFVIYSHYSYDNVSNINLTSIVNPTGEAFNWCNILGIFTPSDGNCTFVTGSGTTIGGKTLNIVGE